MVPIPSDVHWEEEKINRWNFKNRSLPSSIAKVYEDTKTGHPAQARTKPESHLTIDKPLLVQCIPDCKSCNGYIVISNSGRRYKCGCIHHTLQTRG